MRGGEYMYKNLLMSKLRLRGHTQSDLAKILGLSQQRVSAKLNETKGAQFTQGEILVIKENYQLSNDELGDIFFNPQVSVLDTCRAN